MGHLNSVILEQLNALRANYNTRKAPNGALILVNYMPVIRFLEPYVEITEEEAMHLVEEGFPAPVSTKRGKKGEELAAVPYIPSVPGYGYYCNLPLEIKGKDTAYVVFKRSPRAPEQPYLIRVRDTYYKNPNVVNLNTVVSDVYASSIIGKYIHKGVQEWNPVPLNASIPEMRCYNYTTSSFTEMLSRRNAANNTFKLEANHEKLINTHMFIAQTELGHYFSTNRKRSIGTGTLAYCYNSEFVPIYYGFGMDSVLNDIGYEGKPWVETLVNTIQPPAEMLQKYVAVPECCRHLVAKDDKVYREINGVELSNYTTSPVYYLTRQDIFLISKWLTSPAKEGTRDKDNYSYRNVMPYIFNDLFESVAALGVSVPEFYKPNQWVAKVSVHTNTNTGRENKYICFDISRDPNEADNIAEYFLSYTQFATLHYHNYINYLDNAYTYEVYVDDSKRTFELLPTAVLDTERKQALLDTYRQYFLNKFFTQVEV